MGHDIEDTNSRLVEDMTFPYGGYAKVLGGSQLIEGDGLRFGDPDGICWIIVAMSPADEGTSLVIANRAAHVESVLSEAFARPVGEMREETDGLSSILLRDDQPVWVRL